MQHRVARAPNAAPSSPQTVPARREHLPCLAPGTSANVCTGKRWRRHNQPGLSQRLLKQAHVLGQSFARLVAVRLVQVQRMFGCVQGCYGWRAAMHAGLAAGLEPTHRFMAARHGRQRRAKRLRQRTHQHTLPSPKPWCRTEPPPPGPSNPNACVSSTINKPPCGRSAST